MSATLIRPVRAGDAAALAAVYRPYVTDTAISFELDPPNAGEFARRIERVTATHPWLVAERDGAVVGYAYASPYRPRAAYRWVAETAIYVAMEACGGGVGRALYAALLDRLAANGHVAAVAIMTAGNPATARLHEAFGFVEIGVQRGIGYKQGRWHDVAIWQKELAPRPADPAEPRQA